MCVSKNRECIYTVSRRGTKRRLVDPDVLRQHLEKLIGMSFLPMDIRIPGKVPRLQPFQQPDLSSMSLHELNVLQQAIEDQRSRQLLGHPFRGNDQPLKPSVENASCTSPSLANFTPLTPVAAGGGASSLVAPGTAASSSSSPFMPGAMHRSSRTKLRSILTHALEDLHVGGVVQGSEGDSLTQKNMEPADLVSMMMGPALPEGDGDEPTQCLTDIMSAPRAPDSTHNVPPPQPLSAPVSQSERPTMQSLNQQTTPSINAESIPSGLSHTRKLLTDFYLRLYCAIPVLLPAEHLEAYVEWYSSHPYHASPFLLALEAILPLLSEEVEREPSDGPDAFDCPARQRRRKTTYLYARRATEAIDDILETIENNADWGSVLEVLQALAVLSIFEHGCGRAVKARLKADQALGLAFSYGLHRMSSLAAFEDLMMPSKSGLRTAGLLNKFTSTNLFEMSKRVWWSTWMMLLYSSFNTGNLMAIRADDDRITSALPCSSGGPLEPNEWESRMSTIRFLLLVQDYIAALSQAPQENEGVFAPPDTSWGSMQTNSVLRNDSNLWHNTSSSRPTPSRSQLIQKIWALDQSIAREIENFETHSLPWLLSSRQSKATSLSQAESDLVIYQSVMTASHLYGAWMCLHLYFAYQGASTFDCKFCFLKHVSHERNSKRFPCHSIPTTLAGGNSPSVLAQSVSPHIATPDSSTTSAVSVQPITPAQTFIPVPEVYSSVFPSQGMASSLPTTTKQHAFYDRGVDSLPNGPDMYHSQPMESTGDWLLQMAGWPIQSSVPYPSAHQPPVPQSSVHQPSAPQPFATNQVDGTALLPNLSSSGPPDSRQSPRYPAPSNTTEKSAPPRDADVFDPQYSLERCVYASKRLLGNFQQSQLLTNPWMACEGVLIAFTLLMQALSVSNDLYTDTLDKNPVSAPTSALSSGPLSHPSMGPTPSALASFPSSDPTTDPWARDNLGLSGGLAKRTQAHQDRYMVLVSIWQNVQFVCDMLVRQALHYDMVIPMAEEVQSCLQTSQMLFQQYGMDE